MNLPHTTRLVRSLRHKRPARIAILVLFVGSLLTVNVRAADEPAEPYDVLYNVIMTRYGPDGKAYAENEASPAISAWSEFPFGEKTYEKFNAALDAFAALSRTEIEAYSEIQRALLQRHLWEVFDTTFPFAWKDGGWLGRQPFPRSHLDRRAAVQPRIASLIRRLALTKAQILALPNTISATVKSGGFAQHHDPGDRFKPFLPADLYSQESAWVCVGEDDRPIPAGSHTRELEMRSMFLPFLRLPSGRTETLRFLKQSKNRALFPVGTKFALVEQAFLISDDGELILSPLIVGIQLRAYLDVDRSAQKARPEATQCVAEFVMQPRELFKDNAIMKALSPRDHRFGIAGPNAAYFDPYDPFGTGENSEGMPTSTRLNDCMRCHGGRPGVRTRTLMTTRLVFREGHPEAISKATIAQKQNDRTWKTLQDLWQADSAGEDTQSAARSIPSEPLIDNELQPNNGGTATDVSRNALDELYDVLMVRRALNGDVYGDNETVPMIFKFSEFPFDDATYPRLTAALDAITPEEIRESSVLRRAILQRQLWAIFDSTTPSRFVTRRPHKDRRKVVHEQLADLIRQLTLKRSEIDSLPDTLLTTVREKKFPAEFDPDDPTGPFLPPNLMEGRSAWICFSRSSSPVAFHAKSSRWRSAFFQFIRLPKGRDATTEYLNNWNPEKAFPVGTQVALIEKAFLVSDEGNIVLSPLTASIQLRAYRNVEQGSRAADSATQCVAEFISRPRDYMKGSSLMAAMRPSDHRIKVLLANDKHDVLELVNDPTTSSQPRLRQCMNCHGGPGVRSLGDVVVPRGTLKSLKRRNQKEIAEATAQAKRDDESWKRLQAAWGPANH